MPLSPDAVHLPKCPIEAARYDQLYAFNQNVDDQLPASADWKVLRIKEGLPEEQVFRLLPSAVDFEYSGYLTKSRVRYFKGDAMSAGMLMAKPCTFHSHPTKNRYLADVPSLQDIHSFLFYRQMRSVTVGASKIWVWDKSKATLGTVRKLAAWMEANHFRVVAHWMKKDFGTWQAMYVQTVMKKDFGTWQAMYVQTVMKSLGWVWPDTIEEMDAQWPRMVREIFKIKVRVISREPRVNSR